MVVEKIDILPGKLNVAEFESEQPAFEEIYMEARQKEGRVYTDEELKKLPLINPKHPYYTEWQRRKISAQRLFKYLKQKQKKLSILEIGCGNGWLSNYLSFLQFSSVIGQDINLIELMQAKRVYGGKSNLEFRQGDIDYVLNDFLNFDVIIFASSIQYFKDLYAIIQLSREHLSKGGEIHIIDTHFYSEKEIKTARERTKNYYSDLGVPAMSSHYFHHSWKNLSQFNYHQKLNAALMMKSWISRAKLFPWICITND